VKELTSGIIKKFARERGADDVGVANIERWEGAPPHMDPRGIWPEARSVVVIVKRIPRGSYRGIEEGTHWNSYTFYSYNRLNMVFLPRVTYETCCFIEDHGWEAMPIYPGVPEAHPRDDLPRVGKVAPDIFPQMRIAAVAAGLGEIGWSKVFLHPVFGPRVRIGMLLTDAELLPDPIRKPSICDRCLNCARACPGGAIPTDSGEKVEITVDGKEVEWGNTHMGRCVMTHHGLNRKCSPFLAQDFPHLDIDVPKSTLTEEEAYKLCCTLALGEWRKTEEFPSGLVITYYRMILSHTGYFAICGAKGCIRECMIHLEEKKRIKNLFRSKFRKRPEWRLK